MPKTIVGIYFANYDWAEYTEDDEGLTFGESLDNALLELGFHTDADKALIKEIQIWKEETNGK